VRGFRSLIQFDVDIDLKDRHELLSLIPHTVASINDGGRVKPHLTGVYLQSIPSDLVTGLASIDYRKASEDDFFKLDLLNNHIYEQVRDSEHLDALMVAEPQWELLEHVEVVEQLYHINQHAELVKAYAPKSVEELAMVLALIRPGKRHLQGLPLDQIRDEIWSKPEDGKYYFKKSHSVAFATAIVVQLNLIVEQLCSAN
jgi:hypothetical protein